MQKFDKNDYKDAPQKSKRNVNSGLSDQKNVSKFRFRKHIIMILAL